MYVCDLLMAELFPHYDVFINHRGPDVKKTLASLIYHTLSRSGLRVFFDKQELQAGDSLTPAIKSAIRNASVQVAIFSKTYAKSSWCLNELLWMFDCQSSKIIPIFYDIQPSDLRHVEKGAYAGAFEDHRNNGRVTIKQLDRWITALNKVSEISGVVIRTEEDDHGERLEEIVEIVLKEARKERLDVCDYPVGLYQAADRFEEEVLNPSKLTGINTVGIVGLGGSGKSTLVAHLYNSKCFQFERCCFLSDVSKTHLPSLQQTLLRSLLRDQNLCIEDRRRGRSLLRDRLRGLKSVLIVLDDVDNTEQIDNLLFVKDVLGNGSLVLVTSRDRSLLERHGVKIYNVKPLEAKDAHELFCCHAFRHSKPFHVLQSMVEEFVKLCGGFPLALKVLAGQLQNESDPSKWKQKLESLRKQLPKDVVKQIVMDSYESLEVREKEAFLDIAHCLMGEDRDLVERVLDGLFNDNGFQCLQTLRHKCLLEFETEDITRRSSIRGESVNWRRAKGGFKIRMHDLVRDMARQIGRDELPLRLCCSNDRMIVTRDFGQHRSVQKYDVRGIREDEDHQLPGFLQDQDICGLKLLTVQNSNLLQQFNSVSGDLIWFRLRQSRDSLNPPPLSQRSLSNLIPSTPLQRSLISLRNLIPSALLQRSLSNLIHSTLLLRSLRVLEVHGVNPQDFCSLFDDHEPPSQLCALEVTCTNDFGSVSTAGPSTAIPTKHVSASELSDSLQARINIGHWFHGWLGRLNFKNLGKMVLQNIPGLKTLPMKFEEMRNLRHVDLSGCSDLELLPHSFTEELLELEFLALRGCRKLVLRDLGNISKLEYLDFQGCSMLGEMPKGTEVQKSLRHLNVLHTGLTKLPQHLEQLEDLEELLIGSSELTKIPSSLYGLNRLTDLTLLGCTKLDFIDNSIMNLEHLESLRIHKCGMRALPETIGWMNMKILDVQECPLDLEQLLTGVDPGNMKLDSSQSQGGISQSTHPNGSGLTDLIIKDSHIFEIDIPQAESLFPKLETVDLSNNRLLTDIGRLPSSLTLLNLTNCSKLTTLACLSNLAGLKVLDVSGCDELETLNVKGLSSVEVIKGNRCWKLRNIEGLELLKRLSYFQISVNGLSRSSFSKAVVYGAGINDGPEVLKRVENCSEASLELKDCYFTDEKLKGAISVLLITDPNCTIEVAFLQHAYTTYSSSFDNSVHILMMAKDSEVFDEFRFSKDETISFNISVRNSNSLVRAPLQEGWIVEAKNVLEMSSFLSYAFHN